MTIDWSSDNILKVGGEVATFDGELNEPGDWRPHREKLEPWLAAVFQSEHLGLLVGNGLTSAAAHRANIQPPSMDAIDFGSEWNGIIAAKAQEAAARMGRGKPNLEDQLRTAIEIQAGLALLDDQRAEHLARLIDAAIRGLLESILEVERQLVKEFGDDTSLPGLQSRLELGSFLLSVASRAASRDRLQVFTTNYDRLLEYAFEDKGLFALDRFRGALTPRYSSSRLELDLHYNPPGIKGEPRYVEGVVRFTKLHGSIDWRFAGTQIVREPLPFGASADHPAVPVSPLSSVAIYPNSSKDIETAFYPYADLFRDFSAACCRPNSALVTYGYGFGDSHINRVLQDMLSIPSTHLIIISHSKADGRIPEFVRRENPAQLTLLIGPELGSLPSLVTRYMPKPAIDSITHRRSELLKWRGEIEARPTEGPVSEDE